MNYFLDTNICAFHLKGLSKPLANRLIAMGPSRIKIPAIVKGELLYGAAKSYRPGHTAATILLFLRDYEVVPFDDACTGAYSTVRADLERRGVVIGPWDLMIAATVMANDGILVSRNVGEFLRVRGLEVQDWTK